MPPPRVNGEAASHGISKTSQRRAAAARKSKAAVAAASAAASSSGVEGQSILDCAAEAIAASLVADRQLQLDWSLRQLRDALLAENADVGEAAANRCERLRSGIALAVSKALGAYLKTAAIQGVTTSVDIDPATSTECSGATKKRRLAEAIGAATMTDPRVRFEVRQTAGRMMTSDAFTVGRAPECDVQICGDHTVSRLQLVVIPLQGGIVVVDAWSSGGTRVVRRCDPAESLPASVPSQRRAFVVPHGERVIILVGARTTVSLGPPANEAGPLAPPPPMRLAPVRSNAMSQAAVPSTQTTSSSQPTVTAVISSGQTPSSPGPSSAVSTISAVTALSTVSAVTARSAASAAASVTRIEKATAQTDISTFAVTSKPEDWLAAAPEVTVSRPLANALPMASANEQPSALSAQEVSERTAELLVGGEAGTRAVDVGALSSEPATAAAAIATVAQLHAPLDQAPVLSEPPLPAPPSPTSTDLGEGGDVVAVSRLPKAALQRCFAAVQASVRLRRAALERERLRWRCRVARRARVLGDDQCNELEEKLRPSEDGLDEVCDILDGLGVPFAMDDVASGGGAVWICRVCRDSQRARGWRCPNRHRYCRGCMTRWVEERPLPTCPREGCSYRLGEHDLEDLRVNLARREAFRALRLERALLVSQENAQSQMVVFRCPGAGCGAALIHGVGEARRRWICQCGAPPVCTGCGSEPYHYHAPCVAVQCLRARWQAWLHGGREAYRGLQRRAAREATAQHKALRETFDRQSELDRDEASKAENCRLCPRCLCVVEKVEGCNTMICGQTTDGKNRQLGCGQRFNWQTAKPYRAKPGLSRRPQVPSTACAGAISGRGVRHLFTECALCGSGGKCIFGPRFRCIHCPSFSACMKCEERLPVDHQEGHVFQIMFEDDIDWANIGVVLPKGCRVRIRRRDDLTLTEESNLVSINAVRGKRHREDGAGLECIVKDGKRGKYAIEPVGSAVTRHVAIEDLQPLLTQRQAERLLEALPPPNTAATTRAVKVGHERAAAVSLGAASADTVTAEAAITAVVPLPSAKVI
eukprot:TRINITY_DN34328_c0_g1_i1.p1 TRINITY_DN34328_c0_g1~~TRINITY_DN34328_c0_g1_i1.p1  ORF type:complete len:1047 (+),score=155.89 TRINITY_DN34328_c0_g1_i1:48-3188(+)